MKTAAHAPIPGNTAAEWAFYGERFCQNEY